MDIPEDTDISHESSSAVLTAGDAHQSEIVLAKFEALTSQNIPSTHNIGEQVLGYLEVQPSDLHVDNNTIYLEPQEIEIDGQHLILTQGDEAGEIIVVVSTDQDHPSDQTVAEIAQSAMVNAGVVSAVSNTHSSTHFEVLDNCALRTQTFADSSKEHAHIVIEGPQYRRLNPCQNPECAEDHKSPSELLTLKENSQVEKTLPITESCSLQWSLSGEIPSRKMDVKTEMLFIPVSTSVTDCHKLLTSSVATCVKKTITEETLSPQNTISYKEKEDLRPSETSPPLETNLLSQSCEKQTYEPLQEKVELTFPKISTYDPNKSHSLLNSNVLTSVSTIENSPYITLTESHEKYQVTNTKDTYKAISDQLSFDPEFSNSSLEDQDQTPVLIFNTCNESDYNNEKVIDKILLDESSDKSSQLETNSGNMFTSGEFPQEYIDNQHRSILDQENTRTTLKKNFDALDTEPVISQITKQFPLETSSSNSQIELSSNKQEYIGDISQGALIINQKETPVSLNYDKDNVIAVCDDNMNAQLQDSQHAEDSQLEKCDFINITSQKDSVNHTDNISYECSIKDNDSGHLSRNISSLEEQNMDNSIIESKDMSNSQNIIYGNVVESSHTAASSIREAIPHNKEVNFIYSLNEVGSVSSKYSNEKFPSGMDQDIEESSSKHDIMISKPEGGNSVNVSTMEVTKNLEEVKASFNELNNSVHEILQSTTISESTEYIISKSNLNASNVCQESSKDDIRDELIILQAEKHIVPSENIHHMIEISPLAGKDEELTTSVPKQSFDSLEEKWVKVIEQKSPEINLHTSESISDDDEQKVDNSKSKSKILSSHTSTSATNKVSPIVGNNLNESNLSKKKIISKRVEQTSRILRQRTRTSPTIIRITPEYKKSEFRSKEVSGTSTSFVESPVNEKMENFALSITSPIENDVLFSKQNKAKSILPNVKGTLTATKSERPSNIPQKKQKVTDEFEFTSDPENEIDCFRQSTRKFPSRNYSKLRSTNKNDDRMDSPSTSYSDKTSIQVESNVQESTPVNKSRRRKLESKEVVSEKKRKEDDDNSAQEKKSWSLRSKFPLDTSTPLKKEENTEKRSGENLDKEEPQKKKESLPDSGDLLVQPSQDLNTDSETDDKLEKKDEDTKHKSSLNIQTVLSPKRARTRRHARSFTDFDSLRNETPKNTKNQTFRTPPFCIQQKFRKTVVRRTLLKPRQNVVKKIKPRINKKQCEIHIRCQTPSPGKAGSYQCVNCKFSTSRVENLIHHYKDRCLSDNSEIFEWGIEDMDRRQSIRGEEPKENGLSSDLQLQNVAESLSGTSKLSAESDQPGNVPHDSDDDLPSAFDNKPKNKFGFCEDDVVWVEWKRLHWPALVRKIYHKEKRVSVMFIDSPTNKNGIKVFIKRINTFSNAERNKKYLSEGRVTPYGDTVVKAVQKAEDFLRKRCLGINVNTAQFFGNFDDSDEYISDVCSTTSTPSEAERSTVDQNITDATSECSNLDLVPKEEERNISSDRQSEQEVEDSEVIARRKEKRKIQNSKLLKCIKDGKVETHLLGVYRNTIPSSRHQKFHSPVTSVRSQLKHQLWFGPIDDEEQQEELYAYCLQLFKSSCEYPEHFDVVAYVFEVFLPEAIVKAISRIRRVSMDDAEDIFAKGVQWHKLEKKEIEEEFDNSILEKSKQTEEKSEEILDADD